MDAAAEATARAAMSMLEGLWGPKGPSWRRASRKGFAWMVAITDGGVGGRGALWSGSSVFWVVLLRYLVRGRGERTVDPPYTKFPV